MPFGVFVGALDDHLAADGRQSLQQLDQAVLDELAGIFPSWAGRRPGGHLREERYRTYQAVRSLLRALCGSRPLVLILDDVHWADPASAESLAYLLRHPMDAPLLLAMAFRAGRVPPPLEAALATATKEGLATQLEVAPLSRNEADALLRPDLAAGVRAQLYQDSGGNPFYLLELSRATASGSSHGVDEFAEDADAVPPLVRSAIAAELGALGAQERRLLDGAAVAGDPFRLDLAAAAGALSWDDALAALDELQSRDLVRPTEVAAQFRFRHPIVRRAAYQAAGAGWRLGAHARVATKLAEWGGPPAALAHHVEACAQPGDEDAIAILTEAGRVVSAHSPATAARWFRAALRLIPETSRTVSRRRELLLSMADTLRTAGRLDESRDRLRDALRLVDPADVSMRVEVVVACAGLEYLLRRHTETLELLHHTLAELPDQGSLQAALLKVAIGGDLVWSVDQTAPGTWARRALRDAEHLVDLPMQASALGLLAMGAWRVGDLNSVTEAIQAARGALDDLTDAELARRVDAFIWLGWAEALSERADEAIRHCERGLAIVRSSGQGHLLTPLLAGLGYAMQWQGRLSDAIECYDDAIEIALLTATKETHALAAGLRASVATISGDLRGALRYGQQAMEVAGEAADLPAVAAGLFLAEAMLEAGDPRGCIKQMLRSGGGADLLRDERPYRPFWYEILTRAELALGHIDAAQSWAERAEDNAKGLGLSGRTGWAERARAAVLLATGDPRRAVDLARSSAQLLGAAGNPIEQARSHILTGQALAAAGDSQRAVATLRATEAELAAWGAEGYRQQAARELRRLGQRTPRRASRKPAAGEVAELTARELDIAQLVQTGKTNREIAATLYLSEKTVERHLTHIFVKLGVSSRTALASTLTRRIEKSRREHETGTGIG